MNHATPFTSQMFWRYARYEITRSSDKKNYAWSFDINERFINIKILIIIIILNFKF